MSLDSSLDSRIEAGFRYITQLLKQLQSNTESTQGSLADLSTTAKDSLVAAINELQSEVDSTGLSETIDDSSLSPTSTWSSQNINHQITTAIQSLLGGADQASDSLKELADSIAALAAADSGLVSANAEQELSEAQQRQARANINVYAMEQIGDIDQDFVTAINNQYQGTE